MDFEKYINQSNMTSHTKSVKTVKCKQSKPKIIKFIGDMNENIKQIYDSLDCKCTSKRQFFNIMAVFGNKIQKLRKERDHYKTTLKQYFNQISKVNEVHINNPQREKLLTYNSKNKCHTQLRQQDQFKTQLFKDNQFCFSQKKQFKKQKLECSTNLKKSHPSQNYSNDQYMQISLNLSIIQFDHEQKKQNQIQKMNFQQQKLSILSQSNLLDSEEDENINNQKKIASESFVLKERNIENNKRLNVINQLPQFQNKISFTQSKSQKVHYQKNKQVERQKQNLVLGKKDKSLQIRKKSTSDLKYKKQIKIQNTIQKYIKKYTMTLQKLQQFIQKKDCIRQFNKSQQLFLKTQNRFCNKNYGF